MWSIVGIIVLGTVVVLLILEIVRLRRQLGPASGATPAPVPAPAAKSRWQRVRDWCYDKFVIAPLAHGLVSFWGAWLVVCWCGRKFASGCKWCYLSVLAPVGRAIRRWFPSIMDGTHSVAAVVLVAVVLAAVMWWAIPWLYAFRFMYALQLPGISGWDWFYAILGRSLIVAGISFTFWTMLVTVKTNHWRFVTFCGKRTRRVIGEGYHLVAPFWLGGLTGDVKKTTRPAQVVTTAQVQDDEDSTKTVEVTFKGSVLFGQDTSGRDTLDSYILVSDEAAILQEIANTATQELNVLGGNTRLTDCRKNLEAIVRIINCRLRLEECPHVNPKYHLSRILPKGDPRLADPDLSEDAVPVKKRIAFYVKWGQWVERILKTSSSRSELEKRLGVTIKEFKIADTDLSLAVKAAMEKRTQAAAQVAADQKTQEFIKATAEQIAIGKVPIGAYQLAGVLGGKLKPENYNVSTSSFPEAPKVAELIAEGIARAFGKRDG